VKNVQSGPSNEEGIYAPVLSNYAGTSGQNIHSFEMLET